MAKSLGQNIMLVSPGQQGTTLGLVNPLLEEAKADQYAVPDGHPRLPGGGRGLASVAVPRPQDRPSRRCVAGAQVDAVLARHAS
jgi:hypothetical protein